MHVYDISGPADIRQLSIKELEALAAEIRAFLIESISRTGGHLSSNLGIVELTLALHSIILWKLKMYGISLQLCPVCGILPKSREIW